MTRDTNLKQGAPGQDAPLSMLRIATFGDAKKASAAVRRGTIPFYITPEALASIGSTVATATPEVGGKLFGPWARGGVDVFEFDDLGSHRADSTVYRPHHEWATRRVSFWIQRPTAERRVYVGDVHSHPRGVARPSNGIGAHGDLSFARDAIVGNVWMQDFLLPIVCEVQGEQLLFPWAISRSEPEVLLYCDVVMAPVSDFPLRRFNTEWEASKVECHATQPVRCSVNHAVDVSAVAASISATVEAHGSRLRFARGRAAAVVSMPTETNDAPAVLVEARNAQRPFVFSWRIRSTVCFEARLRRLISDALTHATKRY